MMRWTGNRMKKAAVLSASAMLVLGMTACGGSAKPAGNEGADKENVSGGASAGKPETENAGAGEQGASGQEAGKAASRELYQSFLQNEIPVYGEITHIEGYYDPELDETVPLMEDGKNYLLTELLERTILSESRDYGEAELKAVQYAWIDCGKDGEEELAVRVTLSSENLGDCVEEFIIKNIDGKLQVCYRTRSLYRTEESLMNPYGLIGFGGSNGAMSYVDGKACVDADGNYVFLYHCDMEYGLGAYFGDLGGIYAAAANHVDEVGDTEWYLEQYAFTDPNTYDFAANDYEDYLKTLTFGAYPENEPLVKQIFDEAGVTLHTEQELKEMIRKDAEVKGVSDEILDNRDEIAWEELKLDAVDQMIAYGVEPVFVSTTEEFLQAVAEQANIVLEPGTYNVTEYLLDHEDSIKYWVPNGNNQPGVYFTGDGQEPELLIHGLPNLHIASKDPEKMAEIVCEPRYAQVITFDDCNGLRMKNVVMGHTPEQGVCSGDVICLQNCDDVMVSGCDLYGCGAYGVNASDCGSLTFQNTKIHDCSYGCTEIYNSSYVFFDACDFADCRQYTMFETYNSQVNFYGCNFKNLQGEMLSLNDTSFAAFSDCTFDKEALESIQSYDGAGTVNVY